MEIILNASLAGGVACGANADIIIAPYGAMLLGFLTGAISSFGFAYLSKILQDTINLHDTCGVHNLHGMPGVIGGLVSAIIVSRGQANFGSNFGSEFLAEGRSARENAGYQLAGLGLTLGLSIVAGLFTGWLTSRPFFLPVPVNNFFDDQYHWENC